MAMFLLSKFIVKMLMETQPVWIYVTAEGVAVYNVSLFGSLVEDSDDSDSPPKKRSRKKKKKNKNRERWGYDADLLRRKDRIMRIHVRFLWFDFEAAQKVRPHLLAKRRRNPKRRKRSGTTPSSSFKQNISPAVVIFMLILHVILFQGGIRGRRRQVATVQLILNVFWVHLWTDF